MFRLVFLWSSTRNHYCSTLIFDCILGFAFFVCQHHLHVESVSRPKDLIMVALEDDRQESAKGVIKVGGLKAHATMKPVFLSHLDVFLVAYPQLKIKQDQFSLTSSFDAYLEPVQAFLDQVGLQRVV